MEQIILASNSPRRREILTLLGITYLAVDSKYDESLIKTEDPVELVTELALQKALALVKKYPEGIIIGGDTTVYIDGEWLGKAESKEEARQMIRKLAGKTHEVYTGVAVVSALTGESYVGYEVGGVRLMEIKETEIEKYVDNEWNWRGFAGAYALQGGMSRYLLEQSGKLSAIIGMPVELTVELLEKAGVVVEVPPKEIEISLGNMKVGI